jgi:hypothetical protein
MIADSGEEAEPRQLRRDRPGRHQGRHDLASACRSAARSRPRRAQALRRHRPRLSVPVEDRRQADLRKIAKGEAAKGQLTGIDYAIEKADGRLTVTFHRTGASAPANS